MRLDLRRLALLVGLLAASGAYGPASAQTTWHVDDDAAGDPLPGSPVLSDPLEDGSAGHPFDAIQEAIDAAVHGDTVLVADGVYTGLGNRDLDFGGRRIILQSENGPDACIIDCEDSGRGFVFHHAETADSVLDGVTIEGGYVVWDSLYNGVGAGIYCEACAPTITRCTIRSNDAEQDGGGIYCNWGATPTISYCTVTDNLAGSYGGGVACYNGSDVTMIGCNVIENLGVAGSGMASFSSNPTLTNCTFIENASSGAG